MKTSCLNDEKTVEKYESTYLITKKLANSEN